MLAFQRLNNAPPDDPLLLSLPSALAEVSATPEALVINNQLTAKEVPLEHRAAPHHWHLGEVAPSGQLSLDRPLKRTARPELADFLLPAPADSAPFFLTIQRLLGGELDQLPDEYFNAFAKSERAIPFFPIPTVTLSGVFKQYNFKEFTSERKRIHLAQKIRIDDQPPTGPPASLPPTIRQLIGPAVGPITTALAAAFSQRAIWSIREIEGYWAAQCSAAFQEVKWSVAKNALPLVAYTYATGPWKKLWVRHGYNPTKDPMAYQYQVYMWKNVSKAFVLLDNPEILRLVASNPHYTTTVFHPKRGFLTNEGLARIYQALSEVTIPPYASHPGGPTSGSNSLFEKLDFETLDD